MRTLCDIVMYNVILTITVTISHIFFFFCNLRGGCESCTCFLVRLKLAAAPEGLVAAAVEVIIKDI